LKRFEGDSAGGKEATVALGAWWRCRVKESKEREVHGKGVPDGVCTAAAEWSFAHEESVGECSNDAVALNCEGGREWGVGRELREDEGVVGADVGFVGSPWGEAEDAGRWNKNGSAACGEGAVVCGGVYASSMTAHDGKAIFGQSGGVTGDYIYTALGWTSCSDDGECRGIQDTKIALKKEDWWGREAKAQAEFSRVGFVGNRECADAACFELAVELLCFVEEFAPVIKGSMDRIGEAKFATPYDRIKREEALNRVATAVQGVEQSIERRWAKALDA
jgi:hypothetical protein